MVRLDDLFGEASEIDVGRVEDDLKRFLVDGESLHRGFVVVQKMFFFTDKRLLIIRREGFTQTKTDFHTVPYDSIRDFSVDTPGRFENEGELRVWLMGMTSPMRFTINPNVEVYDLHQALSENVLHG